MSKIKILVIGFFASCLVALGVTSAALAVWSPNFQSSDRVVLAEDKTHSGSLYATGSDVTVDGIIEGSVYCAGGTVTINGAVEGDVLCAGQKITINGAVAGDVRAAGQFVQVGGSIGGSLTAFGQDVRLDKGASVGDDINGAAQQATINGTVGRDLAMGLQMIDIHGEIAGGVDIAAEQIYLGSQASILGDFNYSAQRELSFDESQVAGSTSFNPSESEGGQQAGQFLGAVKVMMLMAMAISALTLALVMPRFISRSGEIFSKQMLMTTLLGFGVIFGTPIVVFLLLFTVVLAPIALALLFSWLVILFLSMAFFTYWVGAELLRSQSNIIVRMAGGVVIVFLASAIPVIGGIVMFIGGIVGSGMIVATVTNGYKRPSYQISAKEARKSK